MMLRVLATGPALALALCSVAAAQSLPPAEPPGPHAQPLASADFVTVALQMDEFEVETGRLASMRALRPAVRALASQMVRDHGRNSHTLAAAAEKSRLPRPSSPGLALGQQQQFEQLKATTGPAFDRAYVDGQVRAHLKALSVMTSFIRDGRPGPLRQAALAIRPQISRHLAAFERLQTNAG